MPFAEIKQIEHAAKENSKSKKHPKAHVYMEEDYYFSLPSSYRISDHKENLRRRFNYEPVFQFDGTKDESDEKLHEDPRYYWFKVDDI